MRNFFVPKNRPERKAMQTEEKKLTGYPSIDKPWLKYYSDEAINAPVPECSIYEYMYEKNKEHQSDIALNYFGHKISFGKLFAMIDSAAKSFLALGVKADDIVTIVSVSTVPSIVCFYALNRIGAVSNFVNVLAEPVELKGYFEEARSKVVVTLDLFAEKVSSALTRNVRYVVSFSVDEQMPLFTKLGYHIKTWGKSAQWSTDTEILKWNDFLKRGVAQHEVEIKKDPRKMALLAHTGGTTGTPKAVMLSDFGLNAVVSQYCTASGIKRGEVFLNLMIPFVVYGILANVHLPLCLGLQNVIVPRYESGEWFNYLRKYKPNHVLAVPAYLRPILDDDRISRMDLSFFISAGVGGDGMTDELETELNEFFVNANSDAKVLKGYGMTEVCATAVSVFSYFNKIGSVGVPLMQNNLMIYDRENKTELPYGKVGEICLQCPSRMIGYMNNEEETKALFWEHEDGSEWLHTGDLGYVDEDGFLFLAGRMKRIILTTGGGVAYKVFPNTVESVLDEHDDVIQSCVIGATDGRDQVLKAVCMVGEELLNEPTSAEQKSGDTVGVTTELSSRTGQIESELRALCEKTLPAHARPRFYEFCAELPLTAAGKVDYRKLEETA